MRHILTGRITSFIALLALGLGLATSVHAQPAAKSGFCVSDSLPRAAGNIAARQADCPSGYANQGGSCKREADTRPAPSSAPECPAGYKLDGASCERPALTKPNPGVRAADCPDGYSNSGNACFRLSAPDPLPASRMSCKAGETKIDARCFKPCEAGSTASGANCTRPASILGADKATCKAGLQKDDKRNRCLAQCAAGYSNSGEACVRPADVLGADAMTCKAGETRQGARCVAAAASCGKGEVMQGGACFASCAPGYEGVGAMCWPAAPKGWVSCGIGAAKDAASCAAARLDPVAMVRHNAVLLGREANVPAAPGRQVDRLISLHARFRDLAAAYNSVKDTPQFKRDLAAWSQANQGKEAFAPLDDSGAPTTEPAMVRHAVQLAAIAGFGGPADNGGYPKCSAVK